MAAPVVQAVTTDGAQSGQNTTTTITLTVPSCVINEWIIFFRSYDLGFGGSVATPKLAGVNMTAIGSAQQVGATTGRLDVWRGLVASGGSNNVTFSQSLGSNRVSIDMAALRVSGADTSSPMGATPVQGSSGNATTFSQTLVSATGRLWLFGGLTSGLEVAGGSITISTGSIQSSVDTSNPNASPGLAWLGTASGAGAASVAPQWTVPTSKSWGGIIFDLVAPAGGGTFRNFYGQSAFYGDNG